MALPVYKSRDGALQLSVWANKGENGTFYSADVKRTFKDKQEAWQETYSMGKKDIGTAMVLLNLGYVKIAEFEAADNAAQSASE